jgi:hypothetical protein
MPESAYMRQREAWLERHPEWPQDKELPWPPPYDPPDPLAEPE